MHEIEKDINKLFNKIYISPEQHRGGLTMFPVMHSETMSLPHMSLEQAQARRQLKCSHVSKRGDTFCVECTNLGEAPVMLMDGEELTPSWGSNLSLSIPGGQTLQIPSDYLMRITVEPGSVERSFTAFEPQKDQIGAIFAKDNVILGMDLFASAELFAGLLPTLQHFYLADAYAVPTSRAVRSFVSGPQEFLEEIRKVSCCTLSTPFTQSEHYRLTNAHLIGSVLVVPAQVVHLCVLYLPIFTNHGKSRRACRLLRAPRRVLAGRMTAQGEKTQESAQSARVDHFGNGCGIQLPVTLLHQVAHQFEHVF